MQLTLIKLTKHLVTKYVKRRPLYARN